MDLNCRVISLADLDGIYNFETHKLAEIQPDEAERAMISWNARWRRESLEHLLPLGWSFAAYQTESNSSDDRNLLEEGPLIGYFLAQPLLFFDGFTQSLWIEHLSFNSLKARDELCDLAIKLAREKHFQKVIFPNFSGISNSLASFHPGTWTPQALAINTAKL